MILDVDLDKEEAEGCRDLHGRRFSVEVPVTFSIQAPSERAPSRMAVAVGRTSIAAVVWVTGAGESRTGAPDVTVPGTFVRSFVDALK